MKTTLAVLGMACGLLMAPASVPAFDIHGLMAEKFEELSLPVPTPSYLVVCHGFGCRERTEIGLGPTDHAHLAQFMAGGRASPASERKAIAQAIAWFERRVAPQAGTAHAIARANRLWPTGDPSQFDCIDTSTNTMSLFEVLDQLHLLHYHTLALPVSRHLFIDGEPHTTAVLIEAKSGEFLGVRPMDA